MKKIIRPIYQRLGGLNVNRKQDDRLDLVKHKVLVSSWACRFDVDDCKEKAISLFSNWMSVDDPEKNNPLVIFDCFSFISQNEFILVLNI